MFNYVKGEVTDILENAVVVESAGIGYELAVSAFTLADCAIGRTVKLFAYLQVREDGVTLFGFSTKEEKNMFVNLTSVSGVGCKMAQTILSGMDCKNLAAAISSADTRQLTKVKGLGKKTAERIVLELQEKVFSDAPLPIAAAGEATLSKDMQDAIAVLCSLGKQQAEAERLVQAASKLGATTAKELVNMSFRIN